MIEAAMLWNEPNNKSHWDPELDPDWSIFADTVTRAGRAVVAINPAVIGMGGRLVVAGYHQDGPRQVNMQDWNWKGIDVVNAHERDPAVHRQGLREAAAAAAADRLLGVDLSYRFTDGMTAIADLVGCGALGRVFAIDLVFHNAYGPDKPWFYDRAQSGGGCVMDLGIHLVDLALWATGFPDIARTQASLFAGGAPLHGRDVVEDYAVATLDLADGAVVRLACSWRVHAGRDAVIEASFYGTEGGATLRNVDGSFYDFVAERHRGTARERLAGPPEEWGGRAAVDWARRLAAGGGFDPAARHFVAAADALDRIYAAAGA